MNSRQFHRALKLLCLSQLCLTYRTRAESVCHTTEQDFLELADFEETDPEDVLEHDVRLLQVGMQLQSPRAGPKEPHEAESSLSQPEVDPYGRQRATVMSEEQLEADALAHTVAAYDSRANLALLSLGSSHGHHAVAVRYSLVLQGITHLSSVNLGWLALQVTFGILIAFCAAQIANLQASSGDAVKPSDETTYEEAKKHTLSACYLVVFTDVFAYGVFAPLVPLLREKFGLTATSVAALLATFSFSQAVATPVLGYMSDVLGRRSVILFALIGETFTYVLCSKAENYETLVTCYVLSGIFAATIGVASATVADVTTEEERPVCMSYVSGCTGLGIVLGPSAGALLSGMGFSNTLRVCAVLCGLNFLFAFFNFVDTRHLKKGKSTSSAGKSPSSIPLLAWVLFVASFLTEMNVANWESCGALYINQTFFPYDAVGSTRFFAMLMMAGGCVVILTTVMVFPILHLHTGQLGSFLIGSVISISAKIAGPLVHSRVLFVFCCLLGPLGENLATPNVSALMTELSDPTSVGTCLGLAGTFSAMARIVTPLMFAHLYETKSHPMPFFVVAVAAAVAMCLWVWVYHRKHGAEVLKPLESEASGEPVVDTTKPRGEVKII
eukprot:TRINITY_DN13391_c0_g2_i1.p1 TRINITY_DN13391_c0_g2~~TRINITY_DN13391_c0_g2_i1.p1  ORF type:complete len:613 (+),score=72.52 TRINITY_DN13391_c0_g2_i1:99-1937(+)